MSQLCNQHLCTDAGQMTCLNAAAGVPAAAFLVGGWAHKASGEPYVEDLVASAVPVAAKFLNGGAYHADGRRYVTTQAVASTDQYHGAWRLRTDGALRIITTAVNAADVFPQGVAVKQTGELRMSVT